MWLDIEKLDIRTGDVVRISRGRYGRVGMVVYGITMPGTPMPVKGFTVRVLSKKPKKMSLPKKEDRITLREKDAIS